MARSHTIIKVRVRGIYATALTKILMDEGFQIVQPSRIIADRFKLPDLKLPADVTVKSSERDLNEIVVVGYEGSADRVLSGLQRHLRYAFYWVSPLALHSTVKATVAKRLGDRCIARVGDIEAEIALDNCTEGTEIIASVVRPGVKPLEMPRLVPGARVIGDYAIVFESKEPRVTISEHVRSAAKRAELAAIATIATSRGLSVHWRSSSQHADRTTLENHLKELMDELQKVKKEASEGAAGRKYSTGELVAVVRLSLPDKIYLDRIRDTIVPTIRLHHSVKSNLPSLSTIIDYAEKLKGLNVDETKLLEALLDMIIEHITSLRRIKILHVKPSGEIIELGQGRLRSIYKQGTTLSIVVEREVRGRGVYDGIEVEKEPGDIIVTEIITDNWYIKHTYYSRNGEIKGYYVNINTPPEVYEEGIIYHDLEADIVKKPNGETRIIDTDKLEEIFRKGIITSTLYEKTLSIINEIMGNKASPRTQTNKNANTQT
ncbi:ribonuclease E/G [Pyrofollis japonicus]|uniref:DUF402 domain-containing protein n=1 Tax=Pyrofollis japonicus TaxID=3060460 RepID=UPI00295C26D1|nr:DUF402 domain-containing protein [Pyrofollis japonicus]BEP18094.1 ribonuclease E/G [Pyrofollis japonicus]